MTLARSPRFLRRSLAAGAFAAALCIGLSTAIAGSAPEQSAEGIADGSVTAERTVPQRARLITADEVSLVQVEKATPEGAADGLLAHDLTFVRSLNDAGEMVSGTSQSVPAGEVLQDVIIKNPGPDAALITLLIDGELNELIVAPGHGLAIGEGTSRAFVGATHYCVCECVTASGTFQDGWVCGDGSSACDCAAFDGVRCRANEERGEVSSCFCELRFEIKRITIPNPDAGP